MSNGIHYRERDGKKFAARDPYKMSAFEKAGKLLGKTIEHMWNKNIIPPLFYDDRELQRPIWKKRK